MLDSPKGVRSDAGGKVWAKSDFFFSQQPFPSNRNISVLQPVSENSFWPAGEKYSQAWEGQAWQPPHEASSHCPRVRTLLLVCAQATGARWLSQGHWQSQSRENQVRLSVATSKSSVGSPGLLADMQEGMAKLHP